MSWLSGHPWPRPSVRLRAISATGMPSRPGQPRLYPRPDPRNASLFQTAWVETQAVWRVLRSQPASISRLALFTRSNYALRSYLRATLHAPTCAITNRGLRVSPWSFAQFVLTLCHDIASAFHPGLASPSHCTHARPPHFERPSHRHNRSCVPGTGAVTMQTTTARRPMNSPRSFVAHPARCAESAVRARVVLVWPQTHRIQRCRIAAAEYALDRMELPTSLWLSCRAGRLRFCRVRACWLCRSA